MHKTRWSSGILVSELASISTPITNIDVAKTETSFWFFIETFICVMAVFMMGKALHLAQVPIIPLLVYLDDSSIDTSSRDI